MSHLTRVKASPNHKAFQCVTHSPAFEKDPDASATLTKLWSRGRAWFSLVRKKGLENTDKGNSQRTSHALTSNRAESLTRQASKLTQDHSSISVSSIHRVILLDLLNGSPEH